MDTFMALRKSVAKIIKIGEKMTQTVTFVASVVHEVYGKLFPMPHGLCSANYFVQNRGNLHLDASIGEAKTLRRQNNTQSIHLKQLQSDKQEHS